MENHNAFFWLGIFFIVLNALLLFISPSGWALLGSACGVLLVVGNE